MHIQMLLRENRMFQLKQGYYQNFNSFLFIITFVKTCYNVNIDHLLFFFQVC